MDAWQSDWPFTRATSIGVIHLRDSTLSKITIFLRCLETRGPEVKTYKYTTPLCHPNTRLPTHFISSQNAATAHFQFQKQRINYKMVNPKHESRSEGYNSHSANALLWQSQRTDSLTISPVSSSSCSVRARRRSPRLLFLVSNILWLWAHEYIGISARNAHTNAQACRTAPIS